jgi:hypothetical protein
VWLLGGTDDLKLEKDFAPQNRASEYEWASRRFIEFEWRLIRFWWGLVKDLEKLVSNFRADQAEVLADFVVELWRTMPMTLFCLQPSHLDRLIRWIAAKIPLPKDLIAMLRRVICEMSPLVQPIGIGDPALSEVLPAEGAHPSHLYGII